MSELIPSDYAEMLATVKARIRAAQYEALRAVNKSYGIGTAGKHDGVAAVTGTSCCSLGGVFEQGGFVRF